LLPCSMTTRSTRLRSRSGGSDGDKLRVVNEPIVPSPRDTHPHNSSLFSPYMHCVEEILPGDDMTNSTLSKSELYDTDTAAAYLGVRPHTLEVWRTTRRYDLPFVKVGRLVKYRRADLDAFLTSRTVSV
jgi:excisionase family DNA binding protein